AAAALASGRGLRADAARPRPPHRRRLGAPDAQPGLGPRARRRPGCLRRRRRRRRRRVGGRGRVSPPAPDPLFADPRLAGIYDALETDRADLGAYTALAGE